MGRLGSAAAQLLRVSILPVPWQQKMQYAAATGEARASWGWLARAPAEKDVADVSRIVRRLAGDVGGMGDVSLKRVVRGQGVDVKARALLQSIDVAWRCAHKTRSVPGKWRKGAGWCGALRRAMRRSGWEETGPWRWRHGTDLRYCADPGHAEWSEDRGKVEHVAREGWRRGLFAKWLSGQRVDALACAGSEYMEGRVAAMRGWARESRMARGVLTGSFCSLARFRAIGGPDIPCPWCGMDGETADVGHVVWTCPGEEGKRPEAQPADALQRRLAWPTGLRARRRVDRQILEWFITARRAVIDHSRYGLC